MLPPPPASSSGASAAASDLYENAFVRNAVSALSGDVSRKPPPSASPGASLGGLDHLVDMTVGGCRRGVQMVGRVGRGEPLALALGIGGRGELATADHADRGARAHHADLRAGPCEDEVGAEVLRIHRD